MQALQRRLQRFERFEFLQPQALADSAQKILEYIEQRNSVVLEFGRYGNALEAYILVANYLTRRIHEMYVKKVETALGDPSMEPPQLLITIEEAHKFLDPQIARQTIFGTIARELRKYNVTLLIVDQRPSGIDEEVMSQIGTRVTALLDNERDIAAVLTGISGAGGLREVLARLDTKQQAIILGHAVPMPVVVKTRSYDVEFYKSLTGEGGDAPKPARRDMIANRGGYGNDRKNIASKSSHAGKRPSGSTTSLERAQRRRWSAGSGRTAANGTVSLPFYFQRFPGRARVLKEPPPVKAQHREYGLDDQGRPRVHRVYDYLEQAFESFYRYDETLTEIVEFSMPPRIPLHVEQVFYEQGRVVRYASFRLNGYTPLYSQKGKNPDALYDWLGPNGRMANLEDYVYEGDRLMTIHSYREAPDRRV